MAGRRALPKRLLASVALLAMAAVFAALAVFFTVKGIKWANEFSGVAGLFVALAAFFSPLAGKMLAWLQQGSIETAILSPEEAAKGLAFALAIQWSQQEALRKVNNPWPLPVRWQVTEQARAAMKGVRWPDVGKPGRPVTPSILRRSFDEVDDLLTSRLPRRRLVVLGGVGFGKTILAIHLARKLLSLRAPGDPVPVLLTVATWRPRQQTLVDFAASQLIRDYPALGALVPYGGGNLATMAHALLTTNKVLLIVDGLDEMPTKYRINALLGISQLPADMPLIVTSRTTEYVQAVQHVGRGLPQAAVVELLPLRPSDTRAYLSQATAPPESRWQPVLDHLSHHKDGQLAAVLQTPLMVWLTRTIYAEAGTTPGELIPLALDGDREAIERHLMSKLVHAVYTPGDFSSTTAAKWEPESAEAWLRFVARHLQAEDTPNFAWWDLNRRAPRIVHGVIGGIPIGAPIALVVGLAVGISSAPLAGLTDGLIAGAAVTVLAGLPGGLGSWRQMEPTRVEVRIRDNLGRLAGRLGLGLVFGFGFGALIGVPVVFLYGARYGLLVALALGPAIGSALSLRQLFHASSDINAAVSPASTVHDDTMSAIIQTSMGFIGLGLGAGIALYATVRFGAATGVAIGIAYGLAYGITFAIGYRSSGLATPAFMTFMIARAWLGAQRKLPWALMTFLEDAHQRGVLRQQGAVYQFRHVTLQTHLATSDNNHTSHRKSPTRQAPVQRQ
jgi:hypothetical protein